MKAYLRAMLRTLALLRMRCGCFDTEVEEEGGIADSVWTFKKEKNQDLKVCRFFWRQIFILILLINEEGNF